MRIQVILDSLFARPGSAPFGAEERKVQGLDYGVVSYVYMSHLLNVNM